jgi:putative ABC transport system permease protein
VSAVIAFALASAWRRRRRLAGTVAAVVLGVAFLAATLVVGASARAGFRSSFATADAGIDAYVRSSAELTGGEQNVRPPIAAALVDDVAAVDGVADAAALVEGSAVVAGPDGRPLDGGRPATQAQGWVDVPELTGWRIAAGRAPRNAGEVVVDRAMAEHAGLAVGDRVTVLAPAAVAARVVGVATFGDQDAMPDANLVAFTTAEAQRLLLGSPDLVSAVLVAGDGGVASADLARRVDARLPAGTEALTGAQLIADQQSEVEDDLLSGLSTGLLAFALVALVVAAFGIVNTFTILAAQRARESALLRAIGGTRRQVLSATLVEALLVGLAGSALGVVAGLALAWGLLAATAALGLALPVDGLVLTAGDVLVAVAVGLAVTVAGAVPAAWRASRTAPVAALREVAAEDPTPSRSRTAVGAAVAVAGALLVVAAGGGALGAAAIGAMLLLAGLVLLGPAAVRPVCAVLGTPLARSVDGDLAVRNAVRNPRRSAATASALLVGVGVVSLFTVFGASVARSVDEATSRAFAGDLAVVPASSDGGVAPDLVDRLSRLPEVGAVAGVGRGPAVLGGRQDDMAFADLASLGSVLHLDVVSGDLADAAAGGGLAVSSGYAEERGWALGDRVRVGFPDGSAAEVAIAAIYDRTAVVGDKVVDRSLWAAHAGGPVADEVAVVALAPGVSPDAGRAAVEAATAGPGAPLVRDEAGFVAAEVAPVTGALRVVYALLAVAVVIALMGIANTLSLAVHERTRELGLLRAVGQTRRQLRAMVRRESLLLAAFGAVGGVGLGVYVGWGVVRAIDARAGIATFALPVLPLACVLVAGAAVGVAAGIVPAWRAGRLAVLDAVGGGRS